jgi:hypothetical protein
VVITVQIDRSLSRKAAEILAGVEAREAELEAQETDNADEDGS